MGEAQDQRPFTDRKPFERQIVVVVEIKLTQVSHIEEKW
jgi:hypothetical protein